MNMGPSPDLHGGACSTHAQRGSSGGIAWFFWHVQPRWRLTRSSFTSFSSPRLARPASTGIRLLLPSSPPYARAWTWCTSATCGCSSVWRSFRRRLWWWEVEASCGTHVPLLLTIWGPSEAFGSICLSLFPSLRFAKNIIQ